MTQVHFTCLMNASAYLRMLLSGFKEEDKAATMF